MRIYYYACVHFIGRLLYHRYLFRRVRAAVAGVNYPHRRSFDFESEIDLNAIYYNIRVIIRPVSLTRDHGSETEVTEVTEVTFVFIFSSDYTSLGEGGVNK